MRTRRRRNAAPGAANLRIGAGTQAIAGARISRPTAGAPEHRAEALDILRGLAILMMVFSGQIPYDKPLPRWLFHAQEPPTYDQNHLIVHIFDPTLPGLTFVDLVFPLFLFSLGAAIPLALSHRLDRGESPLKVISGGFLRLLQLAWFAVYLGNIRPVNLHVTPNISTWIIALIGYLLLYPMFTRLPRDWSLQRQFAVRALGYGGGAILLAILTIIHYYPKHLGFQLFRVDVIIVALGDMAFFGTIIWVLTRRNIGTRLAVLTVLLAIRLGASQPGWLQEIWTFAPKNTGWLFAFDYLKYLFLVVPGTIAGDLVHRWIGEGTPASQPQPRVRLIAFCMVTLVLVLGVLVGFESRKLWETALFCAVTVAASLALLSGTTDSTGRLSLNLTHWGSYWLLLGVLLQPFEGGIKKDPSTMSYYFVTLGLAHFVLAALLIVTRALKLNHRLSILAYSGENPMIAYVSMANFIIPVLALTGLLPILNRIFFSPWAGVLLAALETLLLAYLVAQFSRKRLFWRT